MPMTRITIGTTPAKLLDLIRGIVAGASQIFAGLPHGNGCQYLRIEADTGIVFIGNDSTVSATNNGAKLDAAGSPIKIFERESGQGLNNVPLNIWIVGNAPTQIIDVTFQYA